MSDTLDDRSGPVRDLDARRPASRTGRRLTVGALAVMLLLLAYAIFYVASR